MGHTTVSAIVESIIEAGYGNLDDINQVSGLSLTAPQLRALGFAVGDSDYPELGSPWVTTPARAHEVTLSWINMVA